jgi:MFS family permease
MNRSGMHSHGQHTDYSETPAAAPRPDPRLWRHADFLKFWLSQNLSLVGIQFGNLALPLIAITTLHASAAEVSLLSGLAALPWFLFGLVIGVALDRIRRRPVLIAGHLGRALLLVSIPVTSAVGLLSLVQLYVVTFLVGVLSMCFETARHAYLPSLLASTDLAEGNRKMAVTDGVTRVAGPGLAGVTVQVLTAPIAVTVQALMFAASALCIARIRAIEPPPSARESGSVLTSLREGLVYTWNERLIRAFALADGTFLFFFAAMQGVLFVFFSRRLGLSPSTIGLIFTAGSVGGIVGALGARHVRRQVTLSQLIIGGWTLRFLGLVVVPLALFMGPYAALWLVIARLVHAFGWTIWQIYQETTQQLVLPENLRGRVSGSTLFVARSGESLGGFAGAGLAAVSGVVPTLVIAALGTAIGTVWLVASPLMRLHPDAHNQ